MDASAFDTTARLSEAELTRQTLAAAQRMRDMQRIAAHESEENCREERATAAALAAAAEVSASFEASRLTATRLPEAVAPMNMQASGAVPSAGAATSEKEEELELPDWTQHFAGTPLNVMEEAVRKSMARGSRRPPAWEDWRTDLREAGKEMAAEWGKRDKNTRTVETEEQSAAAPVQPTSAKSNQVGKRSLWDQDLS
jgi:hypothetical protein